jgi:hypothetical protein
VCQLLRSVDQEYFMKLVDATVENSVKHVRTFVHQYLAARLEEAREQIYDYGQRYTEAVLNALETSKQGVLCVNVCSLRVRDPASKAAL